MTSLQRASGDNVHTIIRSTRVVTPDGVRPASVHIAGDRIARVSEHDDFHGDARLIDAQGDYVMPGLVDTHVHVNEPGRTEWEGYASATRAAAAGGVTTIFDMPLNSIPATTTIAALEMKRASAQMNAVVNVGFIGGVVPGNAPDLALLSSAGAVLFKCFLVPSGVDEFPCVSEADLRQAMPVLTQCNATLMVHAELPDHINPVPSGDARAYSNYLSTRPELAETSAVDLMVRLSSEFGTRVHIVHVSSAQTVRSLRDARARGVSITAETCPHYLTFQSDRIADGRTEFKCAPPIRDAVCREELWTAVKAGELEAIVSDHSPCPPSMKQRSTGNFMEAWGGIASLQLGLSAVWAGARERGMGIETVVERMSTAPAALAHLGTRKGRLEAGYDADITVFDADASGALSDSALYHKHSLTPYDDTVLAGRVRATYVNGIETFRDGQITNINAGRLIGGEQGTT